MKVKAFLVLALLLGIFFANSVIAVKWALYEKGLENLKALFRSYGKVSRHDVYALISIATIDEPGKGSKIIVEVDRYVSWKFRKSIEELSYPELLDLIHFIECRLRN